MPTHSDNSVPKAKNFNSASDRLPNGKLSDYSPDLQRLIQDLLEDQPYLRPSQLTGVCLSPTECQCWATVHVTIAPLVGERFGPAQPE
ncbi:hypothetical protein RTBOTA2_006966 [Rhodotorula toruloides]|nr:hypothetical protein RTBOTA2_006966 [Rhodotorula toruloides]